MRKPYSFDQPPSGHIGCNVYMKFNMEDLEALTSDQLAALFSGIAEVLAAERRASTPPSAAEVSESKF